MMTKAIVRGLLAVALLASFAGCQSAGGLSHKKKCADCASGLCHRHAMGVPADPEPLTSPTSSPFIPMEKP